MNSNLFVNCSSGIFHDIKGNADNITALLVVDTGLLSSGDLVKLNTYIQEIQKSIDILNTKMFRLAVNNSHFE